MLPDFRHPVHDLVQITVPHTSLHLLGDHFPPEEASEETFDGFHVVGTKHPAEVVVKLEVGGRTCRLVHRPDNIRTE